MPMYSFYLSASIDLTSPYVLIIGASCVIILSYLYNLLAVKTNIPSVLMLILTGVLIGLGLEHFQIPEPDLMPALEIFGIVGLIMIVLEAALDLELNREKLPLIGKSFLIACISLVGTALIVAVLIQKFIDIGLTQALLYSTPLSILSSAIIIPSVGGLIPVKKEFMVYESAFSDILGIMMFYFIIDLLESGEEFAIVHFGTSFLITLAVAVMASYALIYFFRDIAGHVRLFLLIAILLVLYATGKILHLSPLLIILVFGLFLSNHKIFFRIFKNFYEDDDPVAEIEKDFHLITLETAFVVRTFFFVIFGMTISLASLLDSDVLIKSLGILIAIYAVRYIVLKTVLKGDIIPELWIAPRGLITILLFFAIPASAQVPEFKSGILLYVIILSSLIMTFGLIRDKAKQKRRSSVTTPDNTSD